LLQLQVQFRAVFPMWTNRVEAKESGVFSLKLEGQFCLLSLERKKVDKEEKKRIARVGNKLWFMREVAFTGGFAMVRSVTSILLNVKPRNAKRKLAETQTKGTKALERCFAT